MKMSHLYFPSQFFLSTESHYILNEHKLTHQKIYAFYGKLVLEGTCIVQRKFISVMIGRTVKRLTKPPQYYMLLPNFIWMLSTQKLDISDKIMHRPWTVVTSYTLAQQISRLATQVSERLALFILFAMIFMHHIKEQVKPYNCIFSFPEQAGSR